MVKTLKSISSSSIAWLIVVGVFSWCTSLSANAVPADELTVLTQQCKPIGGGFSVYLSKNSVRVEGRTIVIFAQAPKWNVTVMNPLKKVYFQSDYVKALKNIQAARTPFSTLAESNSFTWRKTKGEKIAGLSTEQWANESPGQSHVKSSAKCWTLTEPQFAPQCAEMITAFYGVPSIEHRIPLRFSCRGTGTSFLPMISRHYDDEDVRQQDYCWLDTTTTKKVQASSALFAVPVGFKPTKDYAAIAVEKDLRNSSIDFIFKDLSKHPEALFESR
jgi:hypothetical protein